MATKPTNFTVTLGDLEKILEQIRIAEYHAETGVLAHPDGTPISPLLPSGLRTVDGSYNSLLPGQELLGAADQVMPRLLEPEFLDDADGDQMPLGPEGSGAPTITNTNYDSHISVADADPRIISNLISDQTLGNFSAIFKALELAGSADPMADTAEILAVADPAARLLLAESKGLDISANGSITIENLSPDIGLSPSFNGWMTLFGQFFDHGLDLIPKAGNGTVYIPLQPDDPLYVEGGPNFMALTRAATVTTAGADGIMGTADDQTHETINTTTPFVDQNQTYTSHASHQVFLREYMEHPLTGATIATGHLLDGANGGIANWAEVKAQAVSMLGIELSDHDVLNVPLLRTDPYGKFIPGANGYAQVIVGVGVDGVANTEDDLVVEGDPLVPVSPSAVGALRTGHAFLDDIAHHAAPGFWDHDGNPATAKVAQVADADNLMVDDGDASTYDNELLDRHYITGDGRGNENIGLTAVHTIFHAEHNRLVEDYKQTILSSGSLGTLNDWLLVPVAEIPATQEAINALIWNGERLFQAGRFVTEMEYQHLVFEEFARKVQPAIDPFVFSASPDLDPAIVAEFAHVVYRFGHSMLTETVDRLDAANNIVGGEHIGLIEAFLNPVEFDQDGSVSAEVAAGQIIRGMTRQVGNEIDEFVTDALRNNLVGLPLDLGALNIARGRDTGVPSLNNARAQFFEATGDSRLTPYTSWTDFATHMKNPLSVINFIAAYGTHPSITSETTVEGMRDAAMLLVTGGEGAPTDRLEYLNSTGDWAGVETGLNLVDFWIGGLAEEKQEFGGMLGATFNFVFESQMENLQNGDRFYYLSRTQGMNLLNQLEGNSFAAIVMRNTDLGETGQGHLPGLIFDTPNAILEVVQAVQIGDDPTWGNPILDIIKPLFIRTGFNAVDGNNHFLQYNGADHVVLGGSELNDTLIGGLGIDTLWGDGGDDRLDGGYEADKVYGGDGDDIITNLGGDDFLFGDDGNDVIHMGSGIVLGFGGRGNDFIMTGPDTQEVFAGEGDDFVLGNNGGDLLMGNEGNDWMEGGEGFDTLAGENSELFFNSPIIGHDVLNGQGNDTDYDGESGDDIMFQSSGIQRSNGMAGFDWAIHKGDPNGANSDLGIPIFVNQEAVILRDRFDLVEGLSGWDHDDVLTGRQVVTGANGVGGAAAEFDEFDKWESFSNALLQSAVDRIDGFSDLVAHLDRVQVTWAGETKTVVVMDEAAVTRTGATTASFVDDTAADILLGGGGNDIFLGKAGNDIIDGDRWLNVRLAISGVDGHPDATADTLNGQVYDNLTGEVLFNGRPLHSMMLDRTLNPGQLSIVREILDGGQAGDIDTAVYRGNMDEYDITQNGDGSWTVAHDPAFDGGGGGGNNNGTFDGTDRLFNIERLQFADTTMVIGGDNLPPDGPLVISDTTPAEDQTLTALVGFTDPNGIVPGSMAFTWQMQTVGGGGEVVWVNVGTGQTFVPGDAQVGQVLRAVATYTDLLGLVETVTSAPTAPVSNINDLPTGAVSIDDTTPLVDEILTASNTLADADGMGTVGYQWQMSNDGTIWDDIAGATANSFAVSMAENGALLRVAASYVDGEGTNETVFSAPTEAVTFINNAPTGGVIIDDTTPLVNEILTASNNLNDADGLGGVSYQWQVFDGTDWVDIAGANLATFTVSFSQNGMPLRVAASYVDGLGTLETVFSAATEVVSFINTLPTGVVLIDDTTPVLTQVLTASNTLADEQGLGAVEYQWQVSNDNGATWDDIVGATGATYAVSEVGARLRVAASYVDGFGTTETVFSAATGEVAAFNSITGTNAANTLIGTDLPDSIQGLGGNDTLSGGAGNDTLSGGIGTDLMRGGTGDDLYRVNVTADVVVELAEEGIDTVDSAASYTLSANVENLILRSGFGNINGTGNASDNVLTGNEGANLLSGLDGNDTLIGNAGNDTLNGGAGADSMEGGTGNDLYFVDDAGDQVVEVAGGGGADQVRTTLLAYTLTDQVEILRFTGAGDFDGIGNALNNSLFGGAGNDTLNGGAGNDTMTGGAGNDTYFVDNAGDSVVEGAGGGTDTVITSGNYTLSANVENLTSSNVSGSTLNGNGLANVITGASGNDSISGGGGNDTIVGGAGNDTMAGGTGNDIFVFGSGFGQDRITGFDANPVGGQDLLNISALGINAGNFGANVVISAVGVDTLIGIGADSITLVGVNAATVTQQDFILA
jgi:Ca2+-binding RTX toxin-like protein